LEAVEMLFTAGTGAGEGNADGGAPKLQSPPASERGSSGCVRRVVQSPPRAPPASGRGGRSGRSAEAVAAHDLARLERLTGGFLWLEDQRAERGVRGGDVVEGVEILHLVAQRAAHDQPHDQLDAFRARFAQVF